MRERSQYQGRRCRMKNASTTTVLLDALDYIPPNINRTNWLRVGMALKHEGVTLSTWDKWSQGAPEKYKSGECERLWNNEPEHTPPVTVATVIYIAKTHGFNPPATSNKSRRSPERFHVYRDAQRNPVMVKRVYRKTGKDKDVPTSYALTMNADPSKLNDKTSWSGSKAEWESQTGHEWEQPLYGLPVLIAAPTTENVHFVEGEGKSDVLKRLGFLSTTVGGTGQTIHASQLEHFRQRTVIVWPDNDTVGKRYALEIARQLEAVAESVRIINIDALGLPEHGDVADVIRETESRDACGVDARINAIVQEHSTTLEGFNHMTTINSEGDQTTGSEEAAGGTEPETELHSKPTRKDGPIEFIRWNPTQFLTGRVPFATPEAQLAFVYAANFQGMDRKPIERGKLIANLCGRMRPLTKQQVECAVDELLEQSLLKVGPDNLLSVGFVSENLAEIEDGRREAAKNGKRGADKRWGYK